MKQIIMIVISCLFFLFSSFIHAEDMAGSTFIQKTKPLLFVDKDNDGELDDDEALVVMAAKDYEEVFKTKAPLERMLRSQVEGVEYIVLKNRDFKRMDTNKDSSITAADQHSLHKIYFIKTSEIIKGEFIKTDAEMVTLGKLKGIMLNTNSMKERVKQKEHEAHFKGGDEVNIKTSEEFVPSVGL